MRVIVPLNQVHEIHSPLMETDLIYRTRGLPKHKVVTISYVWERLLWYIHRAIETTICCEDPPWYHLGETTVHNSDHLPCEENICKGRDISRENRIVIVIATPVCDLCQGCRRETAVLVRTTVAMAVMP
jgi:hypothetical protein